MSDLERRRSRRRCSRPRSAAGLDRRSSRRPARLRAGADVAAGPRPQGSSRPSTPTRTARPPATRCARRSSAGSASGIPPRPARSARSRSPPGLPQRCLRRQRPRAVRRGRRCAEPDAAAAARRGDDGGAAGDGAGQAEAAAQGAGARQGGGLRALVDSARRPHDRGAGQEDRRVVDDHHLRPRRHQRAEPEAVRRDLPRQHDRRVPRRCERRGGDGGTAEGAARLRARRQGPRRAFTPRPTPTIRTRRRRAAGCGAGRAAAAPGAAPGARGRGGFGGGRGGAGPLVAQFVAQGDKNSDQTPEPDEFVGARRRLVRQARYRERRPRQPGRIRTAVRRRDPAGAAAGGGRRFDLRAAASGLHRLLEPAGVYAARPRQPGRAPGRSSTR